MCQGEFLSWNALSNGIELMLPLHILIMRYAVYLVFFCNGTPPVPTQRCDVSVSSNGHIMAFRCLSMRRLHSSLPWPSKPVCYVRKTVHCGVIY